MPGHHTAEHRRGNVVEEGRQHEDHREQRDAPGESVGEQVRQVVGNIAPLELVRQHLEADQEQEQVGYDYPFVFCVRQQCCEAAARGEGSHERFEGEDREQAGDADHQRAVVEQRDAEQHEAEQNEFERDELERHARRIATDCAKVCTAAGTRHAAVRRGSIAVTAPRN